MTAEDSLPRFRFATFCKMILSAQHDPGDLSIIGVVNGLTLRIEPEGELPDILDFQVQPLALFSSFDAPRKNRQLTKIQTTLSSPDLMRFQMEPNYIDVPFDQPGLDRTNFSIRLDGVRLRIPGRDGRYTIIAKWRVDEKTLGTLDLPIIVEVVKPQ